VDNKKHNVNEMNKEERRKKNTIQLTELNLDRLEDLFLKFNYRKEELFQEGENKEFGNISIDPDKISQMDIKESIQFLVNKFSLVWFISKIAYDLFIKFEKTISQGQAEAIIRRVLGLKLSSTERSQLYELRKKVKKYKKFVSNFEEWGLEKYDYTLKIIILGLEVPSKEKILHSIVFKPELNTPKTIGVEFFLKEKEILGNMLVRMHIWNISGEERFKFLRSKYYLGASGVIFVYRNDDYASFEQIKEYLKEIKKATNLKFKLKGKPKTYVDMSRILLEIGESEIVSWKEGQALAEEMGALGYLKLPKIMKSTFDEILNLTILQIITKCQNMV